MTFQMLKQSVKTAMKDIDTSRALLKIAYTHAKLGDEKAARDMYIMWQNRFGDTTQDSVCKQLLYDYNQIIEDITSTTTDTDDLADLKLKLEEDPENCQLLYDIAQYYLQKGRYDKVIDYCIK